MWPCGIFISTLQTHHLNDTVYALLYSLQANKYLLMFTGVLRIFFSCPKKLDDRSTTWIQITMWTECSLGIKS